MKFISNTALKQLHELRARRDDDCRMLGVAVVEYALGKRKAYVENAGDEARLHLVLGVVTAELDKHQTAILRRIEEGVKQQKTLGESALVEIGLDPMQREFVINEKTGEVRELIAGEYIEVKE